MLFKIINISRSTALADKTEIAQTIFTRAKGLLGRKGLENGQALIIKDCNSIHTFFMRFPIDVVFVDRNDYVLRVVENIKPFRLSPVAWRASCTIELPVGVVKSSQTQKGDRLKIEPVYSP
jgi:uncharacterized membrane protein (UPF0127 family)